MPVYSIRGRKPDARDQEDQDVVVFGRNFVIICDGHGPNPGGRYIAEVVAALCAAMIPSIVEISHQSCAQLRAIFIEHVCANFENWREKIPDSGTTVIIVVFSTDGQTYMVIKLGDSYVLEVPEGFCGDGRPLAFDSVQLEKQDPEEETEWGTSMSPWQLYMKHRREPGRGSGGSDAFWNHYGARIFMQGHFLIRDGVRLRTMGIEPTLVKQGDDIRRVLESFTICGIFQRKPGHRLVIASDGLPIHKPEIWSALSSDEALRAYFAERSGHDDVTVVVI